MSGWAQGIEGRVQMYGPRGRWACSTAWLKSSVDQKVYLQINDTCPPCRTDPWEDEFHYVRGLFSDFKATSYFRYLLCTPITFCTSSKLPMKMPERS